MKSANRDLRELFQAYVDSQETTIGKRCPSLKVLSDSFEFDTPGRKKKKVIDHLSECSTCREEFRLYFDLQKFPLGERHAGDYGETDVADKFRRQKALFIWRFATIVVGACLIFSSIMLFIKDAEISETERAGAMGIMLVSPVRSLAGSEGLVFRWEAFGDAQYYIVELFDEDLLPVWVSPPVKEVYIQPPAELCANMGAGAVYFWMVTAYSNAAKIGESRLARFKVTAKQ